ncbi:MAG: hypothetical protein LBH97_06165 [Treponema sp.]|nr:hypothetical protein [Treponema sp.]
MAIGFSMTACPHETPNPGNIDQGNIDTGNTGQSNTDTGNTDQSNIGQGNTGTGNADTGNAGQGNTGTGNADTGNAGQGNTDTDNTDQGNTDTDNTDQGNTDTDNIDQGNTDTDNIDQGNTDTDNIDQGNTDPVVPDVNLFEGTWSGYNNSTTMIYTLTFVSDGTWTISPALGMGNGDTGTYTYEDKVATLLSANSTEIGTLTIGVDGKLSGDLKGVSGSSIDNAGKLGGGILGGLGKL